MRFSALALLASYATGSVMASAATSQNAHETLVPRLNCEAGPAERYFEGIQWYVFACDDGASIVVITGPKSPKDLNFYFIVFPQDGNYKLYGEGNGDQALTKPAYDALSAMSIDDLRALHAEAAAVGQGPAPEL